MLIGDNRFHLTFEPMQCSGGDSGLLLTFEEVLEVLTGACSHDTRTHTHPTIPFDPDSSPKQTWDAIIMLFLLYTTFSVPYQLAFGGCPDITEALTAFGVFDVCLDCLFCIDVVLNFMTAFTDRGVYVTGWRAIAVHYAKTWFIIDVGGSIPIDKIVSAALICSDRLAFQPINPNRLCACPPSSKPWTTLGILQGDPEAPPSSEGGQPPRRLVLSGGKRKGPDGVASGVVSRSTPRASSKRFSTFNDL